MNRSTSKGMQTRQRIVDAARRLIDGGRGEGMTTADVANEAGMSKGSLYYYFKDCGDIVRAVVLEELTEVVARFEQAAIHATSAREALGLIVRAYIDLLAEGSPLARAVLSPMHRGFEAGWNAPDIAALRERLHRLVATQIVRGKGEGQVRQDVDADMTAAAIVSTFVAMAARRPELGATPEGRDVLERQILGFIGRGVGAGDSIA